MNEVNHDLKIGDAIDLLVKVKSSIFSTSYEIDEVVRKLFYEEITTKEAALVLSRLASQLRVGKQEGT